MSIIRSLVLDTQQQVFVIEFMLTVCQQAVSITSMTDTYCCVYSARILMMDKKPVRNMQSSIPIFNLFIPAVFFECFGGFCRFQSIHSLFLYMYIFLVCHVDDMFQSLLFQAIFRSIDHFALCNARCDMAVFLVAIHFNIIMFNPLSPELNPICYLLALL